MPGPGVVTGQTDPDGTRVGIPSATIADGSSGQQYRRVGGPGVAVGEWNSLPVLVERLREAIELSLVTGCRRGSGGEPTATSLAESEGSGPDRVRARRSLEQALLDQEDDPEPKKDELKFLEDLLLSDIQTALSRLRETLERTDVATLAKHGGVSDPTSKLHLLRLVSSLLSRLQVPEEKEETDSGENGRTLGAQSDFIIASGRKRRPVRHTIGVSAEEIAHARKQLEESSADLVRLNDQVSARRWETLLPASRNATNNDRHVEEIHDKYTKDVINQRQSLRDKNKDSREDTGAYHSLIPSQIAYADRPDTVNGDRQPRRRGSVDSYQEDSDDEETAIRKANEEQSRVTKLAATLRQRAELISASKCNNNNKFTSKKSKIKRANTVDIPSYLKLQAENLDKPVFLRRPINVGDKIAANAPNLAVPSFHPKTENDKKFLALINRNNEPQTYNAAPGFIKSFGYTKATDMSSLTNENWNSRFSNIKTAFDKPSAVNEAENKLSPKPQPAKRFPVPPQTTNKRAPISDKANNGFPFANASKLDAGFRHAPSSLFRKIEKTQRPKSPPSYHYQRNNPPSPGNTLREKARIMFDRNNDVRQSRHPARFNSNEDSQKSSFPRPPWLEQDRQIENKSNNMVTENGRLDYRLFCKQFAPFVGKSIGNPESKKPRNNEEFRCKRNEHVAPSKEKAVVDGKISLRIFPERNSQYRANELHRVAIEEQADRNKFDHCEKDTFDPIAMRDKDSSGSAFAGNAPIETTLRSSSSVGIQTGIHDDHPEEAHVLRMIPRTSIGPPSAYNNVSVQTYNEPEVESREQWATSRYDNATLDSNYCPPEDPKHFVLDHNRNYHIVTTDDAPRDETLSFVKKNACNLEEDAIRTPNSMENLPLPEIPLGYQSPEQREQIFHASPQHEDYFSSKPEIDNRLEIHQNYPPYVKSHTEEKRKLDPFQESQISNAKSCGILEEDSSYNGAILPEEQNIQNQDISADVGVVTRYTCAIATVASTDIPKRSEPEIDASPVPSSPLQLWSHPTSNERVTTEDEIRRHNMLQQSLVRRLQNERVTLNDCHAFIANQPENFNQPGDFNPPLNSFNQPSKYSPPEVPKRLEQPRRLELPRRLESPKRLEPPKRVEPPKKLESSKKPELPRKPELQKRPEPLKKPKYPPVVTGGLLSVVPSSSTFGATNRVTALRGQYELPKPGTERKERSPISNGVMDPSDEYLVSCANKPSRSIVLSKSESWHQLALTKGPHISLRPSQIDNSLQPLNRGTSYLPKPPAKPKSPSSFKMKKQYEASSSSVNVKRMEDKIRRYFDNPSTNDSVAEMRDSKNRRFSSRDVGKAPIALSRSRTMPGISEESLRLLIPAPQIPMMNLNSAEVDKVFDDIFEEATRNDDHRF